jgi:hypothetical protein
MAYCTVNFMRALLPKVITIGDNNVTSPVLNKPGTAATIDIRTAQLFINFASQEIDSRLSTIYLVPLKRIKVHEESITSDCQAGSKIVYISDNGAYKAGSLVRLGDVDGSEINEVDVLPEDASSLNQVALVNKTGRNFTRGKSSILSLVAVPDPIPLICARMAVAAIIDKQFISEQNPDVSNYGKSQRTLAATDLDEIVAGAIRLNGQDFVGRRFVRMTLRDTHNTSAEIQRGGGKEI